MPNWCQDLLTSQYKKFELMLMRCAKAYSSSCLEIALVCLQPFRRSSLLKCMVQPKIANSGSFKVTDVNTTKKLSTRACCDRQHWLSMPVWNRFHGRLDNNGKITTFRGYRFLMPSCTGFLEPRRSRLRPLKSTFNAENFICSLSYFICSEFCAIRSWNASCSPKLPKSP